MSPGSARPSGGSPDVWGQALVFMTPQSCRVGMTQGKAKMPQSSLFLPTLSCFSLKKQKPAFLEDFGEFLELWKSSF